MKLSLPNEENKEMKRSSKGARRVGVEGGPPTGRHDASNVVHARLYADEGIISNQPVRSLKNKPKELMALSSDQLLDSQ
jgi:hypothetical protein